MTIFSSGIKDERLSAAFKISSVVCSGSWLNVKEFVAIGAGLAVWGVINLLEGYGNDNPGAKSQGIKQLMAGGGVVLIGTQLVPLLANLF